LAHRRRLLQHNRHDSEVSDGGTDFRLSVRIGHCCEAIPISTSLTDLSFVAVCRMCKSKPRTRAAPQHSLLQCRPILPAPAVLNALASRRPSFPHHSHRDVSASISKIAVPQHFPDGGDADRLIKTRFGGDPLPLDRCTPGGLAAEKPASAPAAATEKAVAPMQKSSASGDEWPSLVRRSSATARLGCPPPATTGR
jgi:hypothetical protein